MACEAAQHNEECQMQVGSYCPCNAQRYPLDLFNQIEKPSLHLAGKISDLASTACTPSVSQHLNVQGC